MHLHYVDVSQICDELLALQLVFAATVVPNPVDEDDEDPPGRLAWDQTRLRVKRLRKLLPDNLELVENIPVLSATALRNFLDVISAMYLLGAETGTIDIQISDQEYRQLMWLIREFSTRRPDIPDTFYETWCE